MRKYLCTLMLPVVIVSCSKVEKLESQMDTMSSKTTNMSTTTGEMKDTTETMKTMTGLMFKEVRQKESKDTRVKELEIIRRADTEMGEKITSAAAYYKALEYQLWTGLEFDTVEYRNELMKEAMEELFRKLTDIYSSLQEKKCPVFCQKRIKAMSPISLKRKQVNERSFYALATTLHINNSHQENLFQTEIFSHASLVSAYDIITSALAKDSNQEYLEEWEMVVVRGENKEIAIELLKARANFITALAIKDMANKDNMKISKKMQALLFDISQGLLGNIILDSKFEQANLTTQLDINKKLTEALKTKEQLRSLGIEFKMDNSLFSILENLEVDQSLDAGPIMTEFLMLISELTTEINR